MPERPYTVLSCAISLDGYLDDASVKRLLLSSPSDLDRVDEVRAGSDAILVGAATVRNDNPRLVVRDPQRVAERVRRGRPAMPAKVTLTEHLKLDPDSAFFTHGTGDKLVYCPASRMEEAQDRFGGLATVVDGGEPIGMRRVCEDLHARGVRRLLVEGGGTVLTQFLTEGLADEHRREDEVELVGDSRARRWVDDGDYPWGAGSRAPLLEMRRLDDVVLLRYGLNDQAASSHRLGG